MQRSIVEMQFLQRVAQGVVLVRLDRIQTREHLRLDFLEAGQRLRSGPVSQGDRVAHFGSLDILDARDDEPYFARRKLFSWLRFWRKHTDLFAQMHGTGRHQLDFILRLQAAVHYPHQHHYADIVVEPGIDDQRLERSFGITFGRRDARNNGLENVVHAEATLGRAENRVSGVDADHVLNFLPGVIGICLRQIYLVQHRYHFDAEFGRGIAIGHRLRLDALRGIHHQQRAFTGGERARDFVGKVHMPRRIDQVQVVALAIACRISQRCSLRLDGNAALTLQIHGVKHLCLHLAVRKPAATLNDAIRQGRFAVVDMGDDGEVADLLQNKKRCLFSTLWQVNGRDSLGSDFTGSEPNTHALSARRGSSGITPRRLDQPAPVPVRHIAPPITDRHRRPPRPPRKKTRRAELPARRACHRKDDSRCGCKASDYLSLTPLMVTKTCASPRFTSNVSVADLSILPSKPLNCSTDFTSVWMPLCITARIRSPG